MSTEITELVKNADGTTTWTETVTETDYVRVRRVTATAWDTTVLNCYCCTCDFLFEGHWDPYCRNHNASYGTRPCDKHNMPGSKDDDEQMPLSVQEYRKPNTEPQPAA